MCVLWMRDESQSVLMTRYIYCAVVHPPPAPAPAPHSLDIDADIRVACYDDVPSRVPWYSRPNSTGMQCSG